MDQKSISSQPQETQPLVELSQLVGAEIDTKTSNDDNKHNKHQDNDSDKDKHKENNLDPECHFSEKKNIGELTRCNIAAA